eukprot:35965-Eustigmatos_ZCMA.PRE.1
MIPSSEQAMGLVLHHRAVPHLYVVPYSGLVLSIDGNETRTSAVAALQDSMTQLSNDLTAETAVRASVNG